jgi:hypothetical protein
MIISPPPGAGTGSGCTRVVERLRAPAGAAAGVGTCGRPFSSRSTIMPPDDELSSDGGAWLWQAASTRKKKTSPLLIHYEIARHDRTRAVTLADGSYGAGPAVRHYRVSRPMLLGTTIVVPSSEAIYRMRPW